MTGPHQDDAHQDEDADEAGSLPPEARDADERVRRLRASLSRLRVQSVGEFDQFLAGLADLEHTVDAVSELELPPGQRIELVRALASLMQSAILGLEREWDHATEPGGAYEQALAVVEDLRTYALERRLETRAKTAAAELRTDHDSWQDMYMVATSPARLKELVGEAGWEPPEETIRAWLVRSVSQRRDRP